jgi:hypothetical protein
MNYTLCISTIDTVKFNFIPHEISLFDDILVPSCMIPSIKIDQSLNHSLESIFDEKRRGKYYMFDILYSKIKYIIINDNLPKEKVEKFLTIREKMDGGELKPLKLLITISYNKSCTSNT